MWCHLFVFQLSWHGRLSLSIWSSLWDLKRPLSNSRIAIDDNVEISPLKMIANMELKTISVWVMIARQKLL